MSKSTPLHVARGASVSPSHAITQAYIDGVAPKGWPKYVLKACAAWNYDDGEAMKEALGILMLMVAREAGADSLQMAEYLTPAEPILN